MSGEGEKVAGRFAALVRSIWCRRHHPWLGYALTDSEREELGNGLSASWHRSPCRFCRGHDDEMPKRTNPSERRAVREQAALQGLRHRGVNARIGGAGRVLAPGYGTCFHCDTPWCFVQHHSTTYRSDESGSRGMFPLCETCWQELGTPEARMPYYRMLWQQWQQWPNPDGPTWDDVECAVLDEEPYLGPPTNGRSAD